MVALMLVIVIVGVIIGALVMAIRGRMSRGYRIGTIIGLVIALTAIGVLGAVGWVGSERTIHPAARKPKHTLEEYQFAATTDNITFTSADGTRIVGWFVPAAQTPAPAVALFHGFAENRFELLPHAAYLHAAGYNVLLIDFRGRGDSGGGEVTMGVHEQDDVRAAVAYLRARPEVDPARIAAQGVSLGAAASIMAMANDPSIAALVAESPFADLGGVITQAFEHFIHLPPFPFAPITTWIVELRLGASVDRLRPIDVMPQIGARPVLIIEDLADTVFPPLSGKRLYDVAPGPREFWQVPGAGHAGAYKVAPEEYQRRVLAFYAQAFAARPGQPT